MKAHSFIRYTIAFIILAVITVYAQSRGTPSQIRVRLDANGALVIASASQVNPVSSVAFNNARLALDSSGNLLTVISGGTGVGNLSGTLVSGRVPFATGTNALSDEAEFTYDSTGNVLTAPIHNGGTGTTSTLTLQPTTGVGTTGSDIILKVGTNGGTEAARFYSTGVSTYGLPCSASGCDAVPAFGFQFTGSNIIFDRFSTGSGGALIVGRHARGTVSAPLQTLADDNLTNWIGRGWQVTTPAWATGTNAAIVMQATENFTSTAQGSRIIFQTMQTGTTTVFNNLTISASGLTSSGQTLAVANVGANSCGTTTATVAGNPTAGEVTVGATSGTQCRVAIPQATVTRLNGSCSNQTTAALCRFVAVDTTHFDLLGAFTAGDVIAFTSIGR